MSRFVFVTIFIEFFHMAWLFALCWKMYYYLPSTQLIFHFHFKDIVCKQSSQTMESVSTLKTIYWPKKSGFQKRFLSIPRQYIQHMYKDTKRANTSTSDVLDKDCIPKLLVIYSFGGSKATIDIQYNNKRFSVAHIVFVSEFSDITI